MNADQRDDLRFRCDNQTHAMCLDCWNLMVAFKAEPVYPKYRPKRPCCFCGSSPGAIYFKDESGIVHSELKANEKIVGCLRAIEKEWRLLTGEEKRSWLEGED